MKDEQKKLITRAVDFPGQDHTLLTNENGFVADFRFAARTQKESIANATLCHEAFTVFSRTNKTPVELEEELRWIPVTEKLPEVGVDPSYPNCSNELDVFDGAEVFVGYYESAQWIDSDGEEVEYPITHWKKRPSPPTA